MSTLRVAIALMPFIGTPPLATAAIITELQAYYQFDGNGQDSSSNGLDLNLAGGIGFSTGLIGSALSPGGNASQYAQRPSDDAVFNLTGTDFTIQTWVNFAGLSGEQVIIESFDNAIGPGWSLTKLSDNSIGFAQGAFAFAPNPRSSALSLSTGTWYNISVRRSSNLFEIYLNNALIANSTIFSPNLNSSNPLLIGKRNDGDGRGFSVNGRIDEVAIWTRALTNSELGSLYNGGSGLSLAVPEPASWSGLVLAMICFRLRSVRRRAGSRAEPCGSPPSQMLNRLRADN